MWRVKLIFQSTLRRPAGCMYALSPSPSRIFPGRLTSISHSLLPRPLCSITSFHLPTGVSIERNDDTTSSPISNLKTLPLFSPAPAPPPPPFLALFHFFSERQLILSSEKQREKKEAMEAGGRAGSNNFLPGLLYGRTQTYGRRPRLFSLRWTGGRTRTVSLPLLLARSSGPCCLLRPSVCVVVMLTN